MMHTSCWEYSKAMDTKRKQREKSSEGVETVLIVSASLSSDEILCSSFHGHHPFSISPAPVSSSFPFS